MNGSHKPYKDSAETQRQERRREADRKLEQDRQKMKEVCICVRISAWADCLCLCAFDSKIKLAIISCVVICKCLEATLYRDSLSNLQCIECSDVRQGSLRNGKHD